LKSIEAPIRDMIAVAPVVGFDETGVRAISSLHWLAILPEGLQKNNVASNNILSTL
jgi:hypothetical protein